MRLQQWTCPFSRRARRSAPTIPPAQGERRCGVPHQRPRVVAATPKRPRSSARLSGWHATFSAPGSNMHSFGISAVTLQKEHADKIALADDVAERAKGKKRNQDQQHDDATRDELPER